jgi:signal transduction histidine kinase
LTTLRDITAHRQAEEALRELAATLESKVAARTAELGQRAQQLQKLTLELSQAEERERRRIALILHEDLQQQIAGAKFHLNLARNRARYDPPQQALVDRVDEMLKEAIEKSRCLSHDLSPAVLHMNDLGEVLRWLANRVREQQGLTVQVDVASAATLPSEALTMFLFRAAQEMLFNVVKHAGVNEAALRVRHRGRYVCLRVSDRGRGFDPQEIRKTAGFGLLSIRERVELLGGRMKIKSVPGRGSVFRIVVPDGEQSGDARWKVDEAPPSSGLRRP